jgi:hypothetical protein
MPLAQGGPLRGTLGSGGMALNLVVGSLAASRQVLQQHDGHLVVSVRRQDVRHAYAVATASLAQPVTVPTMFPAS